MLFLHTSHKGYHIAVTSSVQGKISQIPDGKTSIADLNDHLTVQIALTVLNDIRSQ